jgi:hypothetical protein
MPRTPILADVSGRLLMHWLVLPNEFVQSSRYGVNLGVPVAAFISFHEQIKFGVGNSLSAIAPSPKVSRRFEANRFKAEQCIALCCAIH